MTVKAIYAAFVFTLLSSWTVSAANLHPNVNYSQKGLLITSDDNQYRLQIRGRLQFRFANPGDGQPNDIGDFQNEGGNQFDINRARIKVGGHAHRDWIKYYWEYDMADTRTLDLRVMLEKYDALKVKFGQWKVEYSRERSVSSGGQQMLDRSIINRIFTIDRQQGIAIYGHLDGGGAANFNYWTGVFSGSGRGQYHNHDGNVMYTGRFQWNFLGEEVGFINSDISRHDKPIAAVAIAGAKYKSIYTRFSSSGPGSLNDIDIGEQAGQYDVDQFLIDAAYFYKGFNAQAEYHEKHIVDRANGNIPTSLRGYYAQAGYFLNEQFAWWPKPLEVAIRYASYDPNTDAGIENFYEKTLALNWFFRGHNNKLTAEISQIDMEQFGSEVGDRMTYRLQWDVSF